MLIDQVSLRSLNHAKALKSMGLEPTAAEQSERAKGNPVFLDFAPNLQLSEIIIGANSAIKRDDIRALSDNDPNVTIIKARPSARRFAMVDELDLEL